MDERVLTPTMSETTELAREPSRLSAGRLGSERGTAVVEFALVGPLLFLLVLGILDFGRALN